MGLLTQHYGAATFSEYEDSVCLRGVATSVWPILSVFNLKMAPTAAFSAHTIPAQAPLTILLVTITIDPANTDEFLKGFRTCYDRCVEEPECLSFEVFRSQDALGRFRFLEIWSKDRKWFETVSRSMPRRRVLDHTTTFRRLTVGCRYK